MSSLREVIIYQNYMQLFIIILFLVHIRQFKKQWITDKSQKDHNLTKYIDIIIKKQSLNIFKMDMETPKNYDKKSQYTSPIGLLKNYSSINAPSSSNNYEEQFYKIKAQRLEAEIEQLKEQNSILKAKITDCNAANQILREKVFILENNLDRADRSFTQRTVPSFVSDSNYPSAQNSGRESPSKASNFFSVSIPNQKSQRSYNAEIERLVKQNRVLKNEHQVEMTKVRDENKKLNRRILQLQSNFVKKTSEGEQQIEQKMYRQKQEERVLKIEKANNELRKDNQEFERQKKKLEDKLRVLQQNNKALRRQNEQYKVLHSSKSRASDTIQQLQDQLSKKQSQYQQKIERLQNELQKSQNSSKLQSQLSSVNQPIKQIQNTQPPIPSSSKLQKQVQLLKRKITMQESALCQKDQQIKNMLTKLKPLLEKQKNKSVNIKEEVGGDLKRASLSILEVFLKKYKINSF